VALINEETNEEETMKIYAIWNGENNNNNSRRNNNEGVLIIKWRK